MQPLGGQRPPDGGSPFYALQRRLLPVRTASMRGATARARIHGDSSGYVAAEAAFRQLDIPFWLAVTLLEHAELTGDESPIASSMEAVSTAQQ